MIELSRSIEGLPCAMTICDKQGKILYMNRKATETFSKWGGNSLIGQSLFDCHSYESQEKIKHIIEHGETNAYTIEKDGIRKLIYQTPWFVEGKVEGLVELSLVIPETMPHHIRK